MERTHSDVRQTPLYQVDAADLGSQDLVGDYFAAYEACMARIRAVGDVIARGKKPKNLHVAIESMKQGVSSMRTIHNQAGPLLSEETHWCCDRPRSEIMRGGVHIVDWTIALTAIGLTGAGLGEEDKADKTMSALRSVAILGVGAMHVVQGWFSGKTFEQIAYEDDLFTLMKGSAGRIRYVESMIQTFTAWQTLQEHDGIEEVTDLEKDADSLIEALEAVPVRPKTEGGKCRRDILDAFLKTRMGIRMIEQNEKLQNYKRLVEEEYSRGKSNLVKAEDGFESEDVMDVDDDRHLGTPTAAAFLSAKRGNNGRGSLRVRGKKQEGTGRRSSPNMTRTASTGSLTTAKLDEFVQSKFCCFVSWNIPRLVSKIQGKYQTVETESSAVGGALKKHDATDIDFETSIASLRQVLPDIEELERTAKFILNSDTKIPTAAGFRAQQQYRTIIQLLLTSGAFATSTAEAILEYREEEPNQSLKTIAFVALILGQIGARWDNRLQGKVFAKMRDQQILRGILSRKYSATTKGLIKYWEGCQKALVSGHDSDVERAFATRVPKPVLGVFSMEDVAHHIVESHKKKTLEMSPAIQAHDDDQERKEVSFEQAPGRESDFDARVRMLALKAAETHARHDSPSITQHDEEESGNTYAATRRTIAQQAHLPRTPSRRQGYNAAASPQRHEVRLDMPAEEVSNLWDAVDSSDDDVPEGDWELRLKQLDKHESKRRQSQATSSSALDVEVHNVEADDENGGPAVPKSKLPVSKAGSKGDQSGTSSVTSEV